jgi:hypothetical protein
MQRKTSLPLWARHVCVTLALIAFPLVAGAAVNIGVVLDISGEWVLFENGKDVGRIQRGQGVTAGSTVRPRSDEGWVVILLKGDRVIKCEVDDLRDCKQPLTLPRGPSFIGQFWSAVSHLIFNDETIWDGIFTRSPGEDNPQDAVVDFDGGQVDVGPIFRGMLPGRYHLRFIPVKPDGLRSNINPVTLNWEQSAHDKISVPGLTPGLYRLLLLDQSKDDEPSGLEAWVLVSDAEQFQKTSARYRQAQNWSQKWSKGAARDAGHAFLRVYLDYLNRNPARRRYR